MHELPNARLVAHSRGARHMVDPSALLNGARGVYGDEEVARSYGEVPGVPAERVISTADGMTLELAGRPLLFIDTPGHARHHHCIWDAKSRSWFTGDTFGVSYREFDVDGRAWSLPAATPVQFDPDALRTSIERLLSFDPQRVYVTHYGGIPEPPRIARRSAAAGRCDGRDRAAPARRARSAPAAQARVRRAVPRTRSCAWLHDERRAGR